MTKHPLINIVHPTIDHWLPLIRDVKQLDDVDFVQKVIQPGTNCWTIQTYLHLKARGHHIAISNAFIKDAINIAHYDSIPKKFWLRDYFIVSIRADRDPTFIANLEITQNASSATANHQHFISHWPQAALIPRDGRRQTTINNIFFMGVPENISVKIDNDQFLFALDKLGITFRLERRNWHDYSHADLTLAIRDGSDYFLAHKPASKLVNAWRAGVPAILGREPAYREIGRPGYDYLEANTAEEAIAAIRQLKTNPNFFEMIIENGRNSVTRWNTDSVASQWEYFVLEVAERKFADWSKYHRWKTPAHDISFLYKYAKRHLYGYQYFKGCDELGNVLPRSIIWTLRSKLIKP